MAYRIPGNVTTLKELVSRLNTLLQQLGSTNSTTDRRGYYARRRQRLMNYQ